jgi:hypothetical protein
MLGALFALLMAAVTGITCFPHTPILYQNVPETKAESARITVSDWPAIRKTGAKGFSDMTPVLTLSAYAYQEGRSVSSGQKFYHVTM